MFKSDRPTERTHPWYSVRLDVKIADRSASYFSSSRRSWPQTAALYWRLQKALAPFQIGQFTISIVGHHNRGHAEVGVVVYPVAQ